MNPIGGITLLASLWHELEVARADNAKLREQIERLQPKDCEGNALDIADTVSMLRSEYDGDHEWDDVVVELALTKWGGDRWIVRGSKGEAWACDCHKTGYDEDVYEGSDDAEPIVNPSLIEVENAKLRWQMKKLVTMLRVAWDIDASWDGLRRFWNIELTNDGCLMRDRACKAEAENAKLRELGGEVASILFNLDVDRCGLCQRDSISHPCPVHTVKGGECLIKSELRELGVEVQERYDMRDEWEDAIMAENAKLRELVWDLYCLAYPSTVEWEVSEATYDKYSPCEKCNELHGGKSPCVGTANDMTEECCAPIQATVVADRMRELGVEAE